MIVLSSIFANSAQPSVNGLTKWNKNDCYFFWVFLPDFARVWLRDFVRDFLADFRGRFVA